MLHQDTSYTELLTSFPPRPIKDEEDLEKIQVVVDPLLDKGELTESEEDYLNLLGILIYEYESKQDLVPDIYGVELLKVLMAELNLNQKDLVPIFQTESIGIRAFLKTFFFPNALCPLPSALPGGL